MDISSASRVSPPNFASPNIHVWVLSAVISKQIISINIIEKSHYKCNAEMSFQTLEIYQKSPLIITLG